MPFKSLPNQAIDFVLVTALPEERDAVLNRLPGYRKLPPSVADIRNYFQAELPVTFPDNSTGIYRVIILSLLGMGRVQAATAAADAIRQWHPRYVLLIGIAGGIAARGVSLGDILISDQIVDYELQKLTTQGPELRYEIHRADARLLNACNNLISESWQELILVKRPGKGKPQHYIGPIASGDKVIAFRDVLGKYQNEWPKLIGVEMEAGGVATATFQAVDTPGFFMVRCVSDLADEDKDSAGVEKWRSYACDAAASYAIAFLKSGPALLSEDKNREGETFVSIGMDILREVNKRSPGPNDWVPGADLRKSLNLEPAKIFLEITRLEEDGFLEVRGPDKDDFLVHITYLGRLLLKRNI